MGSSQKMAAINSVGECPEALGRLLAYEHTLYPRFLRAA